MSQQRPDIRIRELRQLPAMLPLFAKALARAGVKPGPAPALPAIGARLTDVITDPKHLKAYRKVCGFADDGLLPLSYPHMHVHPLMMTLILDDAFPFAAMGLVHLRNRMTRFRPIKAREQLDVECALGALTRTDAGYEFSVLAQVSTGGEPVWESESTMLMRTGGGSKERRPPTPAEPLTDAIEWKVPGNIGRRYGAVSGDRNPIHLYPLSAKLFGFRRQIAHGMWSKARCLAELTPDFPQQAFSVDVQFKLPLFIPAKVKFARQAVQGGLDFQLVAQDGIKPHLHGQLRLLDS